MPTGRVRDRDAYEFYTGTSPKGAVEWSRDLDRRRHVFRDPGRCGRPSVSYDAGLKRYLLCLTTRGDASSTGGFGIHDAPEPWGPWTTAFRTDRWDVAPGESCSLPTRWMSTDGKTVHLVFSGDDCFAVRRAELVTSDPP